MCIVCEEQCTGNVREEQGMGIMRPEYFFQGAVYGYCARVWVLCAKSRVWVMCTKSIFNELCMGIVRKEHF